MIILTIRTDKPEAELCLYEDDKQLVYVTWQAHRQLADTIHKKLDELLKSRQKSLNDVQGLVCFKGPGSFTGLRIGLSVGNALAYALQVGIVGETGEDWREQGLSRLLAGQSDTLALPEYGAEVHITLAKH